MAIGRAYCTCKTCGAEFEKQEKRGNRADADSWARWAERYYDECSDCYSKRVEEEKIAERAAAMEAAAEDSLPELSGTDKQIEWAITIRFKCMERLRKNVAEPSGWRLRSYGPEFIMDAIAFFASKQKASWWIDNRNYAYTDDGVASLISYNADKIREFAERSSDNDADEEAAASVIAEPSEKTHGGVVYITAADTRVSARYEKDDAFRELVKSLGYRWNPEGREWYKDINFNTGAAAERAAELGNKLLNAGFAVSIADEDIRAAAIEGRYEPQTYRWISSRVSGRYAGMLSISWGRADDFERKAMAIPGARHDKHDVVVPVDRWQEVEDFASMHDFKFSPGAKKAIEQKKASIITVAPAAPKEATYVEHDPADIMQSSNDVLGDLVDD